MPRQSVFGVVFYIVIILSCSIVSCQKDYVLVWSDEFEGSTVDTSKWDYEIDCWGGGNLEKQCYINSDTTLSVQNGILAFHPVLHYPDEYQGQAEGCTNNNENSCTWKQPFTSARIRTLNSRSWLYGRFEFRAKLPIGNFLWPAIWLLPKESVYGVWAASGEIDIVEFRGQPSQYNILEETVHHGGAYPYNVNTGTGPKAFAGKNFSDDFHNFTFHWTHEEISWYVDESLSYNLSLNQSWWSGKGINPYKSNYQPFDQEFYLIFNLAIAGQFFPQKQFGLFDPVDDSKTWTSQFQIDYVRVYQVPTPPQPQPPTPLSNDTVMFLVIGGVGLFVIIVTAIVAFRKCSGSYTTIR